MTQEYYGTKKVTAFKQEGRIPVDGLNKKESEPGYGVIYENGYQSWSPKDVFEKAYQPMDALSFGHAIVAMQEGKKVARAGWNGKGMWIAMQTPCGESKMTLPYLYMRTVQSDLIPWLISQADWQANDWQIVE